MTYRWSNVGRAVHIVRFQIWAIGERRCGPFAGLANIGGIDAVRVRVADVPAYDAFYKKLIAMVPVSDISASFVMEDIKDTTELPL